MSYNTDTAFLSPPDNDFMGSFFRLSRFEFDLEKRVFSFDRNFGPLIGHPPFCVATEAELLQFMPPGDQEHFVMFLQPVKDGQTQVIKKDLQLKTADGTFNWYEFSARLKKNDSSANKRILEGIFVDICERRRAVADLNESERWFREVLEESPHAMYRVDYRKNRFDYVSKGFAKALGYSHEEILNMPYTLFMESIHPEDITKMRPELDKLFAESGGKQFTYHCEFRFKHKGGSYIWLEDTFTVVPDADGQYSYQVGFGSVIEHRKYLEEQLRQSNDQLEERVATRTAELQKANDRLHSLMLERRELEKKLLEISERERRFMGRELHDGICQQIVGVQCMFEALRHRLAAHSAVENDELKMIRDFMHDAVLQIRNLSRGLCPLSLAPEAVGSALATLAAQTSVLYKIDCSFQGSAKARIKNPDAALHVYRITQEAVQNAIRHGKAKNIQITLTEHENQLNMHIENDGLPLDFAKKPAEQEKSGEAGSGLGLKLIDYRVSLLGGDWKIANHEGAVRLSIFAPIDVGVMQ